MVSSSLPCTPPGDDQTLHLAAGTTAAEVLDDFPYLTTEDIQVCFAFAAERERSMLVVIARRCFLTNEEWR